MTRVDDPTDLRAYYERRFAAAQTAGSSIYDELTTMLEAAHRRRMELLDGLPLGDLSSATCVDYGVGSWGFACVFPALQRCALAIGIDVSETAIRESQAVSRAGGFPYGDRYSYRLATERALPLDDASVDVFFAGECIEHVENTDAFLDDVHRVLTDEGRLVLTTPNAGAMFYRARARRYGVGPEHVALMDLAELLSDLGPRFDVRVVKGYNTSLDDRIDGLASPEAAYELASIFEDQPHLASGLVVLATKRDVARPRRYAEQVIGHPAARQRGQWTVADLHEGLTGLLSTGSTKDRLEFPFLGTHLLVLFWSHDWSGEVEVSVDGKVAAQADLFEPAGGFRRLTIAGLSSGQHAAAIRPTGQSSAQSHGAQVIFFKALGYEAID
jgi:SAM-dependent methyltransferase